MSDFNSNRIANNMGPAFGGRDSQGGHIGGGSFVNNSTRQFKTGFVTGHNNGHIGQPPVCPRANTSPMGGGRGGSSFRVQENARLRDHLGQYNDGAARRRSVGRGGFSNRGDGFAGRGGGDHIGQPSHVPIYRPIREIFEEDVKAADGYKTIGEEDEECVVTVTGIPAGLPLRPLNNWEEANFDKKLMDNIERSQYVRPRKIQSVAIPLIMEGYDIKGQAETGSGKSAAFLLPTINKVIQKRASGDYTPELMCPYALIVEPTRELAAQIYDQARKLADGTVVTVSQAYGKFDYEANVCEIAAQGCDIIVGTPGRLIEMFKSKDLKFVNLKMFIMDEADELMCGQTECEIKQIETIQGWPQKENRQTLLFSATFPHEVQIYAGEWLKKANVMVTNRKVIDANSRVVQKFIIVRREDKNNALMKMLKKEMDEAKKENPANPSVKPTLVFVRSKRSADVLSTFLNLHELNTTTINGDRTQQQREEALDGFRKGIFKVVTSTDVCARGLDIKELDRVINLDLPDSITYVHRIGRTGRMREGIATSFFDPDEDMELAKSLIGIVKTAGQVPPAWLVQASEGILPVDESNSNVGDGLASSGGGIGAASAAGDGWGECASSGDWVWTKCGEGWMGQRCQPMEPVDNFENKENTNPNATGYGQ